jgi:hypothetical protein
MSAHDASGPRCAINMKDSGPLSLIYTLLKIQTIPRQLPGLLLLRLGIITVSKNVNEKDLP